MRGMLWQCMTSLKPRHGPFCKCGIPLSDAGRQLIYTKPGVNFTFKVQPMHNHFASSLGQESNGWENCCQGLAIRLRTFTLFMLQICMSVVWMRWTSSLRLTPLVCFNSSPPGCNFMNEIFFVFWSKRHWSLFLRVQLTIIQHWLR